MAGWPVPIHSPRRNMSTLTDTVQNAHRKAAEIRPEVGGFPSWRRSCAKPGSIAPRGRFPRARACM